MIGQGEDEHEAWKDAVEHVWDNMKDFSRTPSDFKVIE